MTNQSNNLAMVTNQTKTIVFFILNGVFMCMREDELKRINEMTITAKKYHREIEDMDAFERQLQLAAAGKLQGVDIANLDKTHQAMAKTFCHTYMQHKSIDADAIELTKQICAATKSPELAYYFLSIQPDNKEIKRLMLTYPDPYYALKYNENISSTPDMQQIIVDSGDSELALYYCLEIGNNASMYQVILHNGTNEQITRYCAAFGDNEDMRKVIINTEKPNAMLNYIDAVANTDEMRQALVATLLKRKAKGLISQIA